MATYMLEAKVSSVPEPNEHYSQSASVSPSCSSSSDDVFSNGDARSSQSSAPSSVKGSPLTYDSEASLENESFTSQRDSEHVLDQPQAGRGPLTSCKVGAELRRHPRRTCAKPSLVETHHESANKKPVPTLIRQCDRKEQFVEALVDTTTEMIEVIWPLSVAQCNLPQGTKNILGLRKFVQEVLRRSKTSYSTLQVALFYLVLLIPYVPRPEVQERRDDPPVCRALRCGRRMFLAALILASKYLQDRNYTMMAWAKISGLKKEEICFNELAFLRTVNYDLHIPEQLFKDWADIVLKYSLEDDCRRARALSGGRCEKWRAIVPHLTRDLRAAMSFDADATDPTGQPEWPQSLQQSMGCSADSSASHRTAAHSSVASGSKQLPPHFLEPRAMTSAEMGPRSPKLSNLETPCLPPINLDCSPAVSRNRCAASGRPSSMGLVMRPDGFPSLVRSCADGLPIVPRVKNLPCSRRSRLSTMGCSSDQSGVCDMASWRGNQARCLEPTNPVPVRVRESCLRVPVEPACDEDSFAARTLQDISRVSSAYPTPKSMDSMTDGSSIASETDEVTTPKVGGHDNRPLVRMARKRERPISVCENDPKADVWQPKKPTNFVCHVGGIIVDYGSGVEDCAIRSRHLRSASGSCDGVRKRNRLDGSNTYVAA